VFAPQQGHDENKFELEEREGADGTIEASLGLRRKVPHLIRSRRPIPVFNLGDLDISELIDRVSSKLNF